MIQRLFKLVPKRGRALLDFLRPAPVAGEVAGEVAADALPSESAAAAADTAVYSPVAALLAGHVLRDGELVILMIRPSRWFVLLSSMRFLGVVGLLTVLAMLFDDRLPYGQRQFAELALVAAAGRLMWATLQWMGRLYILTDLRILRLSGIWTTDVFDCPLRKVARTLLDVTFREGLFRVGSVIIIPQDEEWPLGQWQMVAKPRKVHAQIVSTINRAKNNAGWYR